MALNMKENGVRKKIKNMEKEIRYGRMEVSMKVIGEKMLLVVGVGLCMLMEIFMRDFGRRIKLMDMENTFTKTVPHMKETG
jgi:hypothetical protein